MSKDKLTDYDATAGNNTDIGGISVDEGMLPSNVNNAIREMMSHLKDFAAGTQGVTTIGVDTINETTTDGGVTVDGLLIKDKEIGTSAAPATMQASAINSGQIGGRRNLAYNGAMKISQRGTQTGQTNGDYTACDRFRIVETGDAVVTTSQSTDVPSGQGFANSLKIDVTTADASVAASDQYRVEQRLEGQDLQHLLYGTSDAKDLTISFWVKSPKTGTHILELRHNDATYFNSQAYTISSANTWQKVTLTFSGYTTTALDDDAAFSLSIQWYLMAGSDKTSGTLNSNTWHNTAANRAVGQVNCVDSDANNFYLTGVQVEVGSVATEFEHRTFGEEMLLCKRYYHRLERNDNTDDSALNRGVAAIRIGIAQTQNTTTANSIINLPVAMRANPTLDVSAAADIDYGVGTTTPPATSVTIDSSIGLQTQLVKFTTTAGGLTLGHAGRLQINAVGKHIAFDSEL